VYYEIRGGKRLCGKVAVYGAKNAILPLMAASVLSDTPMRIDNCRPLGDIETMGQILRGVGAEVIWNGQCLSVFAKCVDKWQIPAMLGGKIRASVLLLGGLLARFKRATIPLPGGCAIGSRPIDIHIDGLQRLGASFTLCDNVLYADGRKMHGGKVTLAFPSVGATENLLLAAVLTKGETQLCNCATEPEVVQLQQVLKEMGAQIDGIGTSTLTIQGVDELGGAKVAAIGDRIVAATYLLAAAGTGGKIVVTGVDKQHCQPLLNLLGKSGCNLSYDEGICIQADKLKGFGKVETEPFPGFPTDVQSLLLSVAAICDGNTQVVENLFENRLDHNAAQLNKLGANVSVNGNVASVRGSNLFGSDVYAKDLRGGAALVLAGLFAQGVTRVHNVCHVERGYFDLVGSLRGLGADIKLTN